MGRLWQELKARNVIRICTLYVAIAFGLLELIDIVSGPLNLTSISSPVPGNPEQKQPGHSS